MIGTVVALVARIFIDKLRVKRLSVNNYADNYLLQRISSAAFDFMITASLAAVSIKRIKENFIPILIITAGGGLSMMFYWYYLCRNGS